jgi:cytochrome c oxidase subunit IV
VRAFRPPHALHTGQQFSESSGILSTLSTLGFGILFLLRWILLIFSMLILRGVGLIVKAFLGLVIFSDLLLFVGLLKNSIQLPNPRQRPSM